MTDRWLMTLAFAALFAVVVVRRLRRSFGRQRFRPVGLVFVVVLMSLIATIVSFVTRTPFIFPLAGAAVGTALAMWALRLTRFGVDATGRFYVPNGTIGLVVVALFLGRVLMRLWGVTGLLDRATPEGAFAAAGAGPPDFASSPGTVFVLFVLLGYYVAYYAGVLVRGSRLAEGASPPAS